MNSVMEKAEVLAVAFIFHSNLRVDPDPGILVGSGSGFSKIRIRYTPWYKIPLKYPLYFNIYKDI